MKRVIALLVMMGVLAFVLSACLQEEERTAGTPAASGSATSGAASSDSTTGTPPASPPEGSTSEDASTVPPDTASAPESRQRGPIAILGNADFTVENGVVRGTGTADDPYVISGWEIAVPSGEYYGVRIENVTAQFKLRGLTIQNATQVDGAGIRIGFATGGAIEGCSVLNSRNGIDIVSSTDITMDTCVLYVTGRGLRVVGEAAEQYRHQIADTNLFNDRAIYYYYGLDGDTITGLRGGHLTVAASRNVTISNNEIVNGDGLLLAFVEDSTVQLNLLHRVSNVITEHGIHLYESHGNQVTQNVVKNNRLAGIQLTLSDRNTIAGNFAHVNDSGIRVLASDDNVIEDNNIYACITGISLLGASSNNRVSQNQVFDDQDNMLQGILLEAAITNRVEENLIFGVEMGVVIEEQAMGNTIVGNTLTSGGYGVSLSGSNNVLERNLMSQFSRAVLFPETFQRSTTQGNTFRENVFADNGAHVYTNIDSSGNRFTGNVFLNQGRDMVNDQGTGNIWTVDGIGNYWAGSGIVDSDGNGIADSPVSVYPSEVEDTAPLARFDARTMGLGILAKLELGTAVLETARGDRFEVPAYLADEAVEQATGFRGFPSELSAGFPGILFSFDAERDGKFTMSTVPFDLDIAFFNAAGEWVGGTTMTAQATMLYTSSAAFQFALELPKGSLEELGLEAGSRLVLP